MSSVKFDLDLTKLPSELVMAAAELREWMISHEDRDVFYPVSFFRETAGKVSPLKLILLLAELVEQKQLKVKFRVLMPSGDFSDCEYDTMEDLPDTVYDSTFNPVNIESCRIEPVYHLISHYE